LAANGTRIATSSSGFSGEQNSRPIGATQHTCQMILMSLKTIGRPARTSEIRRAVVSVSPKCAVPLYGCLGELLTAGRLKRITTERDALITVKESAT
jgi:hypothetical protein